MPTAARKRKRTRAADRPNNESSSEHIQTVNSSASQQHQQPAHQVSKSNNSNDLQDPSQGSGSPTDGARNPIAPGAEYTSLRKITRRLPDDPEHFLDGLDTTAADLSWTARDEGDGINPKTGQPWLYPKKRGRREGSNLEEFREEIEEMTKNGQGCKTISEVLVERGVDTSVRAVARQRMKWGLRQRAPRKMTEQGIANIRKAHLEQAKRMANSDPVPVKRVRIRVMRKAEIIRMTNDGMSSAQIAENLQARGVRLKRGAATIERLRTVWGLVPDSQRNANNIRQFCRNQALRLQKEQFENIATELGIEDVKAWVKSKMDEGIALDARREHGYKLMGHLRPKHLVADVTGQSGLHLGTFVAVDKTREHGAAAGDAETPDQLALSAHPEVLSGPGAAHDPIELSDDEAELDSEADEDGGDDQNALAKDFELPLSSLPMELDQSGPEPLQSVSSIDMNDHSRQRLTAEVDPAATNSQASQADLARRQVHDLNTGPSFSDSVLFPAYWAEPNAQGDPGPDGIGQKQSLQSSPAQKQQRQHEERSAEDYSIAPFAFDPFQASSQGWLDPRSMASLPPTSIPGSTTHRLIAPKPTPSQLLVPLPSSRPRPLSPRPPPVITPLGEAELMAKYGLYPVATPRKTPHKYLTPSGLVTTEGYEYLPSVSVLPGLPDSSPDFPAGGGAPPPPQQQQTPPHASLQPQNCTQLRQSSNTQHISPDLIMVPPPPPAPKTSQIPAPTLVVPPDEADKHRASHGAVEKYHKAAVECMGYLAARADARPLVDSLTGMPPSLKDVEGAKARLKEAAEAMLADL